MPELQRLVEKIAGRVAPDTTGVTGRKQKTPSEPPHCGPAASSFWRHRASCPAQCDHCAPCVKQPSQITHSAARHFVCWLRSVKIGRCVAFSLAETTGGKARRNRPASPRSRRKIQSQGVVDLLWSSLFAALHTVCRRIAGSECKCLRNMQNSRLGPAQFCSMPNLYTGYET
jgi:hypothetical protein